MTKKLQGAEPSEGIRTIPLDDPSLVWTTFDLGAATALLCVGFELMTIDRANPGRALFVFRRTNGIEDTADQYFTDRLEVRSRRYFDNLKALKSSIRNE